MPGPMPSSATRSSSPSKSNQPARNSALAEYSVRPSCERVGVGRRGAAAAHPGRARGMRHPGRHAVSVAYVVHDVRDVHARSAVLARRDLHVRQAQLTVQHDVVLFAEGDGMLSLHDQQRVLLQVPEHLALLRKLGERVPHDRRVRTTRSLLGTRSPSIVSASVETDESQRLRYQGIVRRRARARPGATRRLSSWMSPLGMSGPVVEVMSAEVSGSGELRGDPAHERVLAANLLDRAPRARARLRTRWRGSRCTRRS